MPNQIIEDVLHTGVKFTDTRVEYPVERELLLADYDRQIFKIVRTGVQHYITQKYINGSKLIIEGFFRVSIFYQPPSGANLTVISKKLPFTKQLELNEVVAQPYFIVVTGAPQYINTRAVNPTRADIRGIYNFHVQGYTSAKLPVTTAVNSHSVCTDTETVSHFALLGRGSRQFSTEEELSLPPETEKILDITAKSKDITITAYRDKVNIKGDITADILYISENNPGLNSRKRVFSFNQVVDVPGCRENSACYGDINVLGFTVTKNPESEKISCIFTASAEVQAFGKMSVINVCDGFSKKYRYTREKDTVEYDVNIHGINKNLSVVLEDTVPAGYRTCYSFAEISAPVMGISDDRPVLKSKISAAVIVKNTSGEYDCFTRSEDAFFSVDDNDGERNRYIIRPAVKECTADISGDRMKIKVDFALQGYQLVRNTLTKLKSFEENTDKPIENGENAMILYYADKGESLFDIAMKYRTDTEVIKSENSVDGKYLNEDKMLFIPAYGM